ncbi:hypothetical protein AB0L59_10140 [Streptomyces sp. NPDC052109]|uniref:hypothetical protein n=1 Tax=Streptomyces sp. NPDC052109 TaxID=3155527 RepID=UPI003449CFD8
MRWWAGGCAIAVVVVLAGCGASGGGGAKAGASGSRSPRPSSPRASAPPGAPASPGGPASSGGTTTPAAPPSGAPAGPSARACVAGQAEVAVSPGDPVRRRLCVRPGTVVTLVLRPRPDDKRWTGVLSSAPALVVPSGWRVDSDGTAHATLRCAGTRGGTAEVTASAKAPDVAGAARPVLTLDVLVVPYAQEG